MKCGIFGTFDVLNYGDLLFPVIAQRELAERLGEVQVVPYSYHAKEPSGWPYLVKSLAELDNDLPGLNGVIIGGGHVVRFDREIAPGYFPEQPELLAHPESYWLAPAMAALQKNLPVCWNAPSSWGPFPEWSRRLLRDTLTKSAYVSVRDRASAADLEEVAPNARIEIVFDTAFGIDRVLQNAEKSPKAGSGEGNLLSGKKPYLLVQATGSLINLLRQLKAAGIEERYDLCFLPICVCHGDEVDALLAEWPGAAWYNLMPDVEAMAALIRDASGVVASSLHLSITALAFGLPVLRDARSQFGKYDFLKDSPRVFWSHESEDAPCQTFLGALGSRFKCPVAQSAEADLKRHWDRIADALKQGGASTQISAFEAANREIFICKSQEKALEKCRCRLEESRKEVSTQAEEIRRRTETEEALRLQIAELQDQLSRAKGTIGELKRAVKSAQEWQSSWLRRTFHRWHPPVSGGKK